MTEARIRAQIDAATAHIAGLRRWAGELAELAIEKDPWERLGQIAGEIALSIEPLERVFGSPEAPSAEETDRISIAHGSEICTRCHGTGEVPAL